MRLTTLISPEPRFIMLTIILRVISPLPEVSYFVINQSSGFFLLVTILLSTEPRIIMLINTLWMYITSYLILLLSHVNSL